jgi:hypothetical protein
MIGESVSREVNFALRSIHQRHVHSFLPTYSGLPGQDLGRISYMNGN